MVSIRSRLSPEVEASQSAALFRGGTAPWAAGPTPSMLTSPERHSSLPGAAKAPEAALTRRARSLAGSPGAPGRGPRRMTIERDSQSVRPFVDLLRAIAAGAFDVDSAPYPSTARDQELGRLGTDTKRDAACAQTSH